MINHEAPAIPKENLYLGNLQSKDFELEGFETLRNYEMPPLEEVPKKKFKNTAFGRTLRGKNKTGKFIYSALGIAGGLAYGVDIQPALNLLSNESVQTMDLAFWDIVIYALITIITFLTSRSMVKGVLNDLAIEVSGALEALRKARRSDSPEGKDLSPEEVKMLLKEVDDILTIVWRRLLRSKVAKLFGLDITKLFNPNNKK